MPEIVAAHLERVAKELAEAIEAQGQNRCAICWWPLSESLDKGCVRGNCSMRGGSEQDVRSREVIRERIKKNAGIVAAALAACELEAAQRIYTNWNVADRDFEKWLKAHIVAAAALERAVGEKGK